MIKQVIVMRTDLGMNTGKMCAQAAHAAMLFILDESYDEDNNNRFTNEECEWLFPKVATEGWQFGEMKKIVLSVSSLEELNFLCKNASKAGLKVFKVHDKILATITCAAIGPADDVKIDQITGKLPILRSSN